LSHGRRETLELAAAELIDEYKLYISALALCRGDRRGPPDP